MQTKLIFTAPDARRETRCYINEENFGDIAEAADAYYILVASTIKKLADRHLSDYSSSKHLENIFRNMYFYLPYFGTRRTTTADNARSLEAVLRIEICSTFLNVAKESFSTDADNHEQLPAAVFRELCRQRPGLYDEHYFQTLMDRLHQDTF